MKSTFKTKERAIAGITTGLIKLNETVTWRAKHFGIYQQLRVHITAMDKPNSFTDTMISGALKGWPSSFFEANETGTTMQDDFICCTSGNLGKLQN